MPGRVEILTFFAELLDAELSNTLSILAETALKDSSISLCSRMRSMSSSAGSSAVSTSMMPCWRKRSCSFCERLRKLMNSARSRWSASRYSAASFLAWPSGVAYLHHLALHYPQHRRFLAIRKMLRSRPLPQFQKLRNRQMQLLQNRHYSATPAMHRLQGRPARTGCPCRAGRSDIRPC